MGQEIISVNLEAIEIEDGSVAKSLLEQEIATEHGKGLVAIAAAEADRALEDKRKKETDAEAELFVEKKKAEAELAHGEAKNKVLAGQVAAVGGPDNMVLTKKWEAIGLLQNLKGTLVFTDGSEKAPSVIIQASPANPKGVITK